MACKTKIFGSRLRTAVDRFAHYLVTLFIQLKENNDAEEVLLAIVVSYVRVSFSTFTPL